MPNHALQTQSQGESLPALKPNEHIGESCDKKPLLCLEFHCIPEMQGSRVWACVHRHTLKPGHANNTQKIGGKVGVGANLMQADIGI